MKNSFRQPGFVRLFKGSALCFSLAAATIVTGCAGTQPRLVLGPVGPAPMNVAHTKSASGSLMVFSAREAIPEFDPLHDVSALDSSAGNIGYTWEYSRYKILTPDGKIVRSVGNNTGNAEPHPKQIKLPAGNYCVVAKSAGYGRVKVPVVIAGNQVTVLHLDGDDSWSRDHGFSNTNSVRLPNGNIVGWRSTAVIARTP